MRGLLRPFNPGIGPTCCATSCDCCGAADVIGDTDRVTTNSQRRDLTDADARTVA